MNLLSMYKKDLEEKLRFAKNRRVNLERMAKQAFADIERRAHEDKETLVALFYELGMNEQYTIDTISEELDLSERGEVVPVERIEAPPPPKPPEQIAAMDKKGKVIKQTPAAFFNARRGT